MTTKPSDKPATPAGALLLSFLVGGILAWACWLHVSESILHPRTPRIAYDVEAP